YILYSSSASSSHFTKGSRAFTKVCLFHFLVKNSFIKINFLNKKKKKKQVSTSSKTTHTFPLGSFLCGTSGEWCPQQGHPGHT
ncbi:hypothetical protein K5B08_01385, partial [Candidatus Carsonella ruddii]|nr:hypothetical protein [Candidatus Carsonella ruddii]